MSTRRSRTRLRPVSGEGKYLVVCRRQDGRERPWNRYSDREECERVAAHLTKIGCPSRCVGDNELALGGEG